MVNTQQATEKLIGLYRHDFLNTLQVVGGMAQLQKTDRLMAYIRKASEEVQQFGHFIGCGDPRLALLIYEALLEDVGGNYLLQVNGVIPVQPDHILSSLKLTLESVQTLLAEVGEFTLSVTIQGDGRKEIRIHIITDKKETLPWQPVLNKAKSQGMPAEINAVKDELVLYLDKSGSASEK